MNASRHTPFANWFNTNPLAVQSLIAKQLKAGPPVEGGKSPGGLEAENGS
jgi:hypothetical protein